MHIQNKAVPLQPQLRTRSRAFSSAGSEHLPYKQRVGGSNPSTPTPNFFSFFNWLLGRLAQLVQSICLTSRGSAVRIRQRPLPKSINGQIFPFGAFSSAGSEHLPYKQRVGGSNPSTSTEEGVSKCIPSFFMTKPRLSQAEALLLPKDFVSLSISKVIWQRYIFGINVKT